MSREEKRNWEQVTDLNKEEEMEVEVEVEKP